MTRQKAAPAPEPADTPMHALVRELIADLQAMRAKIPGFRDAHPKTRKLVRTYRSVPREFIAKMNDTVKQSEEMKSFGTYNPEAGAETLDFVDNFKLFRSFVEMFLSGVNFTIEYRHAEIAERALETYQLSKALRSGPRSNLRMHVAELRQALNRAGSRRRRKKTGRAQATAKKVE
jgi:hypothetical protein